MNQLTDVFVEEVRTQVDIVDVISEHVQLRRAGRSFVGLCPFHNERSPSFSVSPERQMFHCFGCGAGGTVIRFVMDIDGLSFVEAVLSLAARAKVPIPETLQVSQRDEVTESISARIREAHVLTAKLYNYILMNTSAGVQALSYLEGRGISKKTIMTFQMGYAPDAKDTVISFLQRRGFDKNTLVESGLAVAIDEKLVDRFRGRVMIPICDAQGRVIAFGGRTMQPLGKPKYLNSPETRVFHKGLVLFNQHLARKAIRQTQTAILLEGYMDVIAVWQSGLETGVASLGTSLTVEQAQLLKRFANRVIIAYDGDSAGVAATRRALDVFDEVNLEVRIVHLPDGQDPDEFIQAHGSEAFAHELSVRALTPVQFLLRQARLSADLLSQAGRTDFLRTSLEILSQRASPIEQETELRILSQEFQVSIQTLKEELHLVSKQSKTHRRPVREVASAAVKSVPGKPPKGHVEAGNRLLQALLCHAPTCSFLLDRDVDELALPEQTALLALLYAWRMSAEHSEPANFLDTLDDRSLRGLASALLVDAPEEYNTDLLEDYIRKVRTHQLEQTYKRTLEALVQYQIDGNLEAIESLKEEADALQKEITFLKSPAAGMRTRQGVKEAGIK